MITKNTCVYSLPFILFFTCSYSFQSFENFNTAVQKQNEFPQATGDAWSNPNYQKKTKEDFTFTLSSLENQLKDAYTQVQSIFHTPIGLLKVPANAELYIWSEIQGSVHSLWRSLSYLIQKNILTKELKLTNPNTYLIFNGNVIGRGPYNLEALSLVLQLIKKNPGTVIYLLGEQEYNGAWKDHGTKHELLALKNDGSIPLSHELNILFNALPKALFITTSDKPEELLRISYQGQEDYSVAIHMHCDEIIKAPQGLSPLIKKNPNNEIACTDVLATIQGAPLFFPYLARMKGLGLVLQDEGATAWSILSSPIKPNLDFLDFRYDSFAKITLAKTLSASTITHVINDIQTKNNFQKESLFNLVSGAPTKPGAPAPEAIELGSLIARLALIGGMETRTGLLIRINEANQNNEIPGKYIRVRVLDDKYMPSLTRKKLPELKARNIDIFLEPYGTPTTEIYLDDIKKGNILTLFPQSGALVLSDPALDYMFHFKGNNVIATHALIDYLIKNFNIRKFALFYQNDSFGKTPLNAAKNAFEKYDDIEWIEVPYTRGIIDLKEQAEKIKSFQPDALGLFSFSTYSQELIRNIGLDSIANTIIFGTFDAGDISSRRFFKKQGLEPVSLASTVPNPAISTMPMVQSYRQAMKLYGVPYDNYSLEAYIGASIAVDALKKIDGPITKETLKKQLESYNNYSLDGFNLTYNPQIRSLSDSVWFERGPLKQWKKIV